MLIGFSPEILAIGESDIYWHYPHGSKDAPTEFILNQKITLEVDFEQSVQEGEVTSVSCDVTRYDFQGNEHVEDTDLSLSPAQTWARWTRDYYLTFESGGKLRFVFTVLDTDGNYLTRTGWGIIGDDGGSGSDISMYSVLKILGGALIVIGLITKR